VDIKRRDVLAATVASPLVDLVDPATPPTRRPSRDLPTALDLPDVPADLVTPKSASAARLEGRKPSPTPTPAAAAVKTATPAPATVTAVVAGGEDISDWI
jgi:hypothetical protein